MGICLNLAATDPHPQTDRHENPPKHRRPIGSARHARQRSLDDLWHAAGHHHDGSHCLARPGLRGGDGELLSVATARNRVLDGNGLFLDRPHHHNRWTYAFGVRPKHRAGEL